jgi:hypothetical protein
LKDRDYKNHLFSKEKQRKQKEASRHMFFKVNTFTFIKFGVSFKREGFFVTLSCACSDL